MFDPRDISEALATRNPNTLQCVHGVSTDTFQVSDDETGVVLKFYGHDRAHATTIIHLVVSPDEAETLCTQVMGHLLDNSPGRTGT